MSHEIICKTSQSFEAFNMQVMSMTCRKTSDAVKAIIIMLSCIVNGLVWVPKISTPDLEHGHGTSLEKTFNLSSSTPWMKYGTMLHI